MLLRKILGTSAAKNRVEREAQLYRSLIQREAKIGGEIFGPVGRGGRREFFCLDEHTWIWHEEWVDERGQRQVRTTRYDVSPKGILKAQDGQNYQKVGLNEAEHLYKAAEIYEQKIKAMYASATA